MEMAAVVVEATEGVDINTIWGEQSWVINHLFSTTLRTDKSPIQCAAEWLAKTPDLGWDSAETKSGLASDLKMLKSLEMGFW